MEYKDPGRYIPIIYLLYSWGSLFGVPSRVPLIIGNWSHALSRKMTPQIVSLHSKDTNLHVGFPRVCPTTFGLELLLDRNSELSSNFRMYSKP